VPAETSPISLEEAIYPYPDVGEREQEDQRAEPDVVEGRPAAERADQRRQQRHAADEEVDHRDLAVTNPAEEPEPVEEQNGSHPEKKQRDHRPAHTSRGSSHGLPEYRDGVRARPQRTGVAPFGSEARCARRSRGWPWSDPARSVGCRTRRSRPAGRV